jgi:hypothetical protein
MGWLLADIGTTLVVALTYWAVAVLRDTARSLAGVGRRARTRDSTAPARGLRALRPQHFEGVDPDCARRAAP